jgi:hypothetical protein
MNSPFGRVTDPFMLQRAIRLTGPAPGTFLGINNQGFDHNKLPSSYYMEYWSAGVMGSKTGKAILLFLWTHYSNTPLLQYSNH